MRKVVLLLLIAFVAAGCTPFWTPDTSYVLSGRVVDEQGRGVGGIEIRVSGVGPTKTAADGTWVIDGVRGSVEVRPSSQQWYSFSPPQYRNITSGRTGLDFRMMQGPSGGEPYNPCLDPDLAKRIAEDKGLGSMAIGDYGMVSEFGHDQWPSMDGEYSLLQAGTPIMGAAVVSRDRAKRWLMSSPTPEEFWVLVDLYYDLGPIYNIRPDVALAQAAHETGYFRFRGVAHPLMNNFAGIGVTNVVPPELPPLRGADPDRVCFREGVHGAIFVDKATGVEAQIQHLYAYASTHPLPAGRVLLSPRFTLVTRGIAPTLEGLTKRWASDSEYHVKIGGLLSAMMDTP